ncbi:hypothetical protein H4S06_000934 [Coemansia sp. BCRC 34490]|nr:hypothetical protein H4S06_000934 [Coemansia sp. BCRC 34490]
MTADRHHRRASNAGGSGSGSGNGSGSGSGSGNISFQQIDMSEMSPQSRKRYQSRVSSARLRERQRQRISETEIDIAKLEKRVHMLSAMLERHRELESSQLVGGPISSPAAHRDAGDPNNIHQSLGQAIDNLGSCVERIEMLRSRIAEKVDALESLPCDNVSSRHSIAFLVDDCGHQSDCGEDFS